MARAYRGGRGSRRVGCRPGGSRRPARVARVVSATTPLPVITHDVFVLYKDSYKGYDEATISGSVTDPDATADEVAVLYAQPFPYKAAPAPVAGQSVAVPASTTPTDYSFAAKPTVATKFTVEVLSSISATTPLATSAVKVVYVVTNQPFSGIKTCRLRSVTKRPALSLCYLTRPTRSRVTRSGTSTSISSSAGGASRSHRSTCTYPRSRPLAG